jgi:hypothetical protein
VHNLLEDDFTLLVVNAQHIKAVPGCKTDVKDADWIPLCINVDRPGSMCLECRGNPIPIKY